VAAELHCFPRASLRIRFIPFFVCSNRRDFLLCAFFSLAWGAKATSCGFDRGKKSHAACACDGQTDFCTTARSIRPQPLLQGSGADPMADASTWPDDVRPCARKPRVALTSTFRWHVTPGDCEVLPLPESCVTRPSLTSSLSCVLQESIPEKADALRFLIHFVGDLHSPARHEHNDRAEIACPSLLRPLRS